MVTQPLGGSLVKGRGQSTESRTPIWVLVIFPVKTKLGIGLLSSPRALHMRGLI